MAKFIEIHVTFASTEEARTICQKLLEAKLIGCAQLLPHIESMYWWEDQIESSPEVLAFIKAKAANYPAIEALILAHHSYETPEIITIAIDQGHRDYLEWLKGL